MWLIIIVTASIYVVPVEFNSKNECRETALELRESHISLKKAGVYCVPKEVWVSGENGLLYEYEVGERQ